MWVTTFELRRYVGMRRSPATDTELLAATGSDPEAFGEFYDRYETAVVGYLLRRTGDVELAIDLAGEAFATALQSASRYRPGPKDGHSAAP
jgi:DNA-directed RNA polymerase specialized sigma24 family protein